MVPVVWLKTPTMCAHTLAVRAPVWVASSKWLLPAPCAENITCEPCWNKPKLRVPLAKLPREMMVCQRLTLVVLGRTHASRVNDPPRRRSEVDKVDTVPWKLTGEVGAVVGYAAAFAAVPANVAEPLVPPNGDDPPKVTPEAPTATARVAPEASVGVVPAALLKRNHNVGPSVVTVVP